VITVWVSQARSGSGIEDVRGTDIETHPLLRAQNPKSCSPQRMGHSAPTRSDAWMDIANDMSGCRVEFAIWLKV
jgi:hypothetical protein